MKVYFMSLASGSSGNCYYLGTSEYGILIDAGIGVRTIKRVLKDNNIALEKIHAVLITHDHTDHIKSIGYISKKLHIPVYTTELVHQGINNNRNVTEKLYNCDVHHVVKEEAFTIKDFTIEAFEVPHDSTDCVGYSIQIGNCNFAFLTDMGQITPTSSKYIQKSNYLIIESNYDIEMLEHGAYPAYLKSRIVGPHGHMCNTDTANYLAENFPKDLRYIWLCHLSKDNNHPELACKTMELKLKEKNIIVGKDVQLAALKRNTPSEMYIFE